MTKRRKALPARKPRDRSRDDDSLLLRSAESLGRVIGALQRQLDSATKRLLNTDDDVIERIERKVEKPETKKATTKKATTKKATTRKMKTPAKTRGARKRAKKR